MSVKISSNLFAKCRRRPGWQTALSLLYASLAVPLLTGCGGSDSTAPAPMDVSVYSTLQTPVDVGALLQIVPSPTPAFDPSIHDYVVDCNSAGSVDLTATAPASYDFAYLGTTTQSVVIRPTDSDAQFRRTVQLNPGQALKFSVTNSGIYYMRCLPPDFPPLSVSINGTPQAQWYVFAPDIGANGFGLGSYVIITDAHGTPVWWFSEAAQTIADAKVLDSHHIAWTRLTATGSYYIRNFDGQTVNTLTGDLDVHELQPTASGTYLVIRNEVRTCPPDCADLSPWGGSAQTSVTDGEILEIDQHSNVLWVWRTRDHISLSETGGTGWLPSVGGDIIHLNSVEPDGPDGVLFTARHLNAAYRVIKSTGAIDWKLGGTARPESLTVVGDVRPTAVAPYVLVGMHDIRKWPDGTISVHDNGTFTSTFIGRAPWIVRYSLDLTNRVAQVVQELNDERASSSFCCGSARLLPGGNWLVQWGAEPFMAELDSSGNPVFTIQYNLGSAFSYRAVPVAPGLVAAATLRKGMDLIYGE